MSREKSAVALAGCLAANCHPSSPLNECFPKSGLHTRHLQSENIDQTGSVCLHCHWEYDTHPLHRNGSVNGFDNDSNVRVPGNIVFFGGTDALYNGGIVGGRFYTDTGSCQEISCHGPAASARLDWYDQSDCVVCHYASQAINPLVTGDSHTRGKHAYHVTGLGIECENCHSKYREHRNHLNAIYGRQDDDSPVSAGGYWPDSSAPVTIAFDRGTGECSAVSCHAGVADWYIDASGCTACHSVGSGIDPGTTGSHQKHAFDLSYDCAVCHYDYPGKVSHSDGTLNTALTVPQMLSFDPGGLATRLGQDSNTPFYNAALQTCDQIYCHSDGVSAQTSGDYNGIILYLTAPNSPPTQSNFSTVTWGGTVQCGQCHLGADPVADNICSPSPSSDCDFPDTGRHREPGNWHRDGDYEALDMTSPPGNYWVTQCFWCHNTNNDTDHQGTYNTPYHVDGSVYFYPRFVNNGGTMWGGLEPTRNTHCGGPSGSNCWYP